MCRGDNLASAGLLGGLGCLRNLCLTRALKLQLIKHAARIMALHDCRCAPIATVLTNCDAFGRRASALVHCGRLRYIHELVLKPLALLPAS